MYGQGTLVFPDSLTSLPLRRGEGGAGELMGNSYVYTERTFGVSQGMPVMQAEPKVSYLSSGGRHPHAPTSLAVSK